MIFHLFITSLALCMNIFAQTPITITRENVQVAVKNFLGYKEEKKEEMIQFLSQIPREELIKLIKQFDQMSTKKNENDGFGFDEIVLKGWYAEKATSIITDEKERKKINEAIQDGILVAFDEEIGFSVIEIGQSPLYIVYVTPEQAEAVVMQFNEILEQKTAEFMTQQEEGESDEAYEARKSPIQKALEEKMHKAEKKATEAQKTKDKKKAERLMKEAQDIATSVQAEFGQNAERALETACNECFKKYGVQFIYGMLLFRALGKASKPIMAEAIKTVKATFRKK